MPRRIPGTARIRIREQARLIASLEEKIQNRDQTIADLDRHRHELYQERDELLHRIDTLEARVSHLLALDASPAAPGGF